MKNKFFSLLLFLFTALTSIAPYSSNNRIQQNKDLISKELSYSISSYDYSDEYQEFTSPTFEFEPSEEIKNYISSYITYDNNKILLDNDVFNETDTLITQCDDTSGEQINDYISFVKTNINIMNGFVESGYGIITEAGEFEVNYDVFYENEYTQQSDFIYGFEYNFWTGAKFYMNNMATVIVGTLGVVIGMLSLSKAISTAFKKIKDPSHILTKGLLGEPGNVKVLFNNIGSNIISEVSSIIPLDVVSRIASAIITISSIAKAALNFAGAWKFLIQVIATIISAYLPTVVFGLAMVFSALFLGSDSYAKIRLFSSSYYIL